MSDNLIGLSTDPLENLTGWANRLMQTNTALGLAESLAEYAEAWQKERDAMKARVAELEAEVERLRVIELPEITNHPQAGKMWNLGLATLGWKGYEWSKEARALVALLNDGRSK